MTHIPPSVTSASLLWLITLATFMHQHSHVPEIEHVLDMPATQTFLSFSSSSKALARPESSLRNKHASRFINTKTQRSWVQFHTLILLATAEPTFGLPKTLINNQPPSHPLLRQPGAVVPIYHRLFKGTLAADRKTEQAGLMTRPGLLLLLRHSESQPFPETMDAAHVFLCSVPEPQLQPLPH